MKYIRTKDGVFKISDLFPRHYYSYEEQKEIEIPKDSAIYIDFESFYPGCKVADTIEELCDELVWITPEKEHHIKPKTGDGLWLLCCNYKDGHKIYGAIWTNKGLIYVAKMNEKGELELL